MQRLVLDVRTAAQSRSSLLITGERDEALLIARLAHEVGATHCTASRFVVVDPQVLSESLAQFSIPSSSRESRARQYRASEARWTLCVGDVDQLTPSAQERLLSFLDVVCASESALHPWVIATTTENLAERVKSKDFLKDLFYRLNVVHVLLSAAPVGSPSSLDYLISEVGERAGGEPTQLSFHRLQELLASDRLHASAQLYQLLASV